MTSLLDLHALLLSQFPTAIENTVLAVGELTLTVNASHLNDLCLRLRDDPAFAFHQCVDVCGVDYLTYGQTEWETTGATATGFDRAVEPLSLTANLTTPRFAVVYHLLSLKHNQRLRLKVFLADAECLQIDSLMNVWPSVNWFEREAFDLYGILFVGHPDLRRILTDYGFIGHPFRKDFPLSGHLEVRYDAASSRVVYEPVSIKPRVLVPKVIRNNP